MLKKKSIAIMIIGLAIVLLILFVNNIKKIENISRLSMKAEEISLFSYIMYDNQEENNIKCLVNVNSENGIEYIEKPNGERIICNKNVSLSFDYPVTKDTEYKFKIKEANKEIQEETLIVNDEYINNEILRIENTTEETRNNNIRDNKIYESKWLRRCIL